jgi:hypothetical protein
MKTAKQIATAAVIGMTVLAGATAGAAGQGEQQIAQASHSLRVGDVVYRDATSQRYVATRIGALLPILRKGHELHIVTAVMDGSFAAAPMDTEIEAAAKKGAGATLWPEARKSGQGLTLGTHWAAFVHLLLHADYELLVTQNAHGLKVGDVVCLNERSGYLVRIPTGRLAKEEAAGTPLFLVTETETHTADFRISRVETATDTIAATQTTGPELAQSAHP